MTEKIKSAIYCLKHPALQELCEKCTHYDDCDGDNYVKEYIDLSIRSLQAWDEVLQKLEKDRDFFTSIDGEYARGMVFATSEAIDIINQHLAEIEE